MNVASLICYVFNAKPRNAYVLLPNAWCRLGMYATNIMAKIESRKGIANVKEIIKVADGLVFSRGNLGTCLDPEKVFIAQKMILRVRREFMCRVTAVSKRV